MSSSIFDQVMLYDLWLLSLTLSISASLILFSLYLRSKGTPIGRNAFYVSLSSLLWSFALVAYAIPSIEKVEVYVGIFLVGSSFACAVSMLGAYERAKIQGILTPSGRKKQDSRTWLALSVLALNVAFIGVLRFILSNPTLLNMMEGMSILTGLSFILIAGSLIALSRPTFPNKFIYLLIGLALAIAFTTIFGHWLEIPALYAPLPGGGTSVSTALGLIIASLGVAVARQRGLKAWVVKVNTAVGVLVIGVLAVLGYILGLPTLYSASSFARLSPPTALCFVLVGFALLLRNWRTSQV